LAPVASFHYQLQNLDVAAASSSPFPLLVTDYSLDGSAATELSASDVASLRSGGRKVLAYLSIGEAETYRFYWNPAWTDEGRDDPDRPPWLGPVNPGLTDVAAGNYNYRTTFSLEGFDFATAALTSSFGADNRLTEVPKIYQGVVHRKPNMRQPALSQ